MDWINRFQLFLFDFDGLLVNTEHLHYQAYIDMMAKRGYRLNWGFDRFCESAHLHATAVREAIYADFPGLDPDWPTLYEAKKQAYFDLLNAGKVELMPGAEKLLRALEKADIARCVATNSFYAQIDAIRRQIPLLQSIPHWITREDYSKQKPDPECYLKAIQSWGQPGGRIIGFEDSIRGIQALQKTGALPVLVCSAIHPLRKMTEAIHFESLDAIPSDWV